MGTQTILKNDGIFVVDDYKKKRAAQRLSELASDLTHEIRRSIEADVEAVMVAPSVFNDAEANVTQAKSLDANVERVDDDSLAVNIDKHLDLILGREQVKSRLDLIEAQNLDEKFKDYEYINTKAFSIDGEDQGDEIKAYLISKEAYDLFDSISVGAPGYAGTGDGTLDAFEYKVGLSSVAESITLTATSATEFTVAGSVSGTLGTLTVGTPFESALVNAEISAGGTPFQAGDEFTIAITVA
jgi:hypothetical protein